MAARKIEPGISRILDDNGRAHGWQVVVDVGTGRRDRQQHRRSFRTLEEARAWRADMRSKRAAGTVAPSSKATVAELLDTWMLGARHLKPSTRYGYQVHLKPVRDRLGSVEVQKLTKRHVEIVVEHLLTTGGAQGRGRSASTVRQSLVVLEQAIDDALQQGVVMHNVVRLVSKPRMQRREMKTWSAAQLASFLREANEHRYACLWRIAAFGLRRSEVLGLRWCDVDFERAHIRIVQTRVSVDGRKIATGEPKTASGRRTIPADPVTLDALRRFKRKQAREKLVAGAAYQTSGLIGVDELGTRCDRRRSGTISLACPSRQACHRFVYMTSATRRRA